jgi:hypothetical protein
VEDLMALAFIRALGLLVAFAAAVLPAEAATINAASCSGADVAAALSSASSGDTVTIPAGVCSWDDGIVVDSGITLRGAGIDVTTIQDENADRNEALITVRGNSRITAFTVKYGSVTGNNGNGVIRASGGGWRIDHMKIDRVFAGYAVNSWDILAYGGVFDSNTVIVRANHGAFRVWGGSSQQSDTSWASPTSFGTGRVNAFVENNTFALEPGAPLNGFVDSQGGARVVYRYNTFADVRHGCHDTSSSGRVRGTRQLEVYGNRLVDTMRFTYSLRVCSTGLYFGNAAATVSTDASTWGFANRVDRLTKSAPPWGLCDGTKVYDGNTIPTGYPCMDQVGRGQSVDFGGAPVPDRRANNALEPVYAWLNTIARGGNEPVNLSPRRGISGCLACGTDYFVPDRDFYTYTESFDGTSGVGAGPAKARPATCRVGVAYWATDEGEWNSLQPGPDGRLYKCTASNTWSVSYTPYMYPHPIRTSGPLADAPGSGTLPSAPTNLKVQ